MTRPTDDENQLEKAQRILGRFETRRAEAMCALMTIVRQLYNENAELRDKVEELQRSSKTCQLLEWKRPKEEPRVEEHPILWLCEQKARERG